MTYSAITFRSHPNDKHLDEDFLTLIMPILTKSKKFIIGIDDKDKLSQHFHVCFEFTGDRSHLVQKFNSKKFKNWYQQIKNNNLSTIIDPKFHEQALQIKQVEKDESDHHLMKWIGYCCKEHLKAGYMGFDDDYILQCIKYYNLNARIEASKKPKEGWKYIKVNTSHAIITEFAKEHNISTSDPNIWSLMAEHKISCANLSRHQRTTIISELIIYDQRDTESYEKSYASDCLKYNTDEPMQDQTIMTNIKKFEEQNKMISKYQKLLIENNIAF